MKIDDIFRKCIEIPGVSIKRSEFNAELLMKTKEGKGSMTFFQLFPGLTIAYIFINSPTWAAPNLGEDSFIKKGPLLLNYCVTGRCEIILNNGNFVYVKDGDISLTECFAQKQYVYPRRIYEGMELFVDTNTLATESTWMQKEFGIDIPKIIELFCPNDNTYISAVTPEVEEILIKLWELFDIAPPFSISQMKIYVLALFSLLQNLNNIPPSQACTFFTETQVDIAKRVEKIITSDLRQHHPAWELAAQFSVSETSLKNYFRGVFGQIGVQQIECDTCGNGNDYLFVIVEYAFDLVDNFFYAPRFYGNDDDVGTFDRFYIVQREDEIRIRIPYFLQSRI